MEKQKADQIITKYLEKIYGFAFKKAYSYDEAEELSAEMTAEVYSSLLTADSVYNINGYIWHICENVYARYVTQIKRQEGFCENYMRALSISRSEGNAELKEKYLLRREIAFLSSLRRDIVFSFYYKNESIRKIALRHGIPEGTVKWHLNKSRKDLKEGMNTERKIGKLGLQPVIANSIDHDGNPGSKGGPEYFLDDKLNLNIVYSTYFKPKTLDEIAEELGITPVFIEDRINMLSDNGYLIKKRGGKYTTLVEFSSRTYSLEQIDKIRIAKMKMADELAKKYVPIIIESISDYKDIYIPSGNRELLYAAAVFYAVREKCSLDVKKPHNYEKYFIKDTYGGNYVVFVELRQDCIDPDYKFKVEGNFDACGAMWRGSAKYPVRSWAVDTHIDNRKGMWKNNKTEDYEYLYELMTGKLSDGIEDSDKINRLKERSFIDDTKKPQIMIARDPASDLFNKIPKLDKKIKDRYSEIALEYTMLTAKEYPPQMQDMMISAAAGFIGNELPVMLLDKLYQNGTFKPLTETERVTANLIMFSDMLPE